MTTVNPDLAANLGFSQPPDLPPHVVAIIEGIGARVVSPDLPPPLALTARAVAHSVSSPNVSDQIIQDARATLGHLRTALGEASPQVSVQQPGNRLQEELLTTLHYAEANGDQRAIRAIQAALGTTATPR